MTAEERKRANQLAARRRWEKFRAANPERIAAYGRKWRALHADQERERARRRRATHDPRLLALHKARQERYRLKRNARLRQRYASDPAFVEAARARARRHRQRTYAATYARVQVASHCHDSVNTITGGGGAPSVEERNGTAPPPAGQGGRTFRYLQHQNTGGAGPARVAELRDQIARGVYVPFAALRAEFAGVARVPSVPCDRELARTERKRQYERTPAQEQRRQKWELAQGEAVPVGKDEARAQKAANMRAWYAANRERVMEQRRRRREQARGATAEAAP
jgi:hypothetical protein